MFSKKKFSKNGITRLVLSLLSFLLQVVWLMILGTYLNRYSTAIALLIDLLSFLVVLFVYNKGNTTTTFKLPWIILILLFPFIGIILYILSGKNYNTEKQRQKYLQINKSINKFEYLDDNLLKQISLEDKRISNQFYYLSKSCGFPVFYNDKALFFDKACNAFSCQLKDIEAAEKFIFMEYHAIEQDAISFEQLLTVLKRKVEQGVEVRILYDDVGSIGFVNHGFVKELESLGIKCRVFNPVSPLIKLFMNNRDHRKITVIDGLIGYTGGYNLADEYFGYKKPYGEWKDTGIRFTGLAVNTLTRLFLEMWINPKKDEIKIDDYFNTSSNETLMPEGFIAPYADSPLDNDYVGEDVYMNMIKNAQYYVYITTPYLILDDEMKRELILAVKRGVDVRIVTPGIPDKKIIYRITRSYYSELVCSGVKVFEYTPGFIHSKQVLVDDNFAAVGTINMDFRSFYHHFENGVLLYKVGCILDIKDDFISIFEKSKDVSEIYKQKKYQRINLFDSFLRLFSSLL